MIEILSMSAAMMQREYIKRLKVVDKMLIIEFELIDMSKI